MGEAIKEDMEVGMYTNGGHGAQFFDRPGGGGGGGRSGGGGGGGMMFNGNANGAPVGTLNPCCCCCHRLSIKETMD